MKCSMDLSPASVLHIHPHCPHLSGRDHMIREADFTCRMEEIHLIERKGRESYVPAGQRSTGLLFPGPFHLRPLLYNPQQRLVASLAGFLLLRQRLTPLGLPAIHVLLAHWLRLSQVEALSSILPAPFCTARAGLSP